MLNVLFLCTGNSARSIMADAILNLYGWGRFAAFSAGSQPKGQVYPLSLKILEERGYPTEGPRSKDLAELEVRGEPRMSFLFTVCDQAAQTCPVWSGAPIKTHWGGPDPVEVKGDEATRRTASVQAFEFLEARIRCFLALPLESMDAPALRRRLPEIGESTGSAAQVAPVAAPA